MTCVMQVILLKDFTQSKVAKVETPGYDPYK